MRDAETGPSGVADLSHHPKKHLWSGFWRSENFGPVVLAISVGLIGGLGAWFFRWLIDMASGLFFTTGAGALSFPGGTHVILFPVIGLVIVSVIVRRWAPEAEGHGVPEVMYAIRREGGRIRPRVAVVKVLASALCIGSGGSVGREGPIVQIGCTIGSWLGQVLKLGDRRVKLLVACGAAAGVGGTFNAPIAGVIFALEVILGSFAARSFGLVVISSVTSTAVCRAAMGEAHAFELSRVFTLRSYAELPIYLALGLLAGFAAVFFVRFLYLQEDLLGRWRVHPLLKATCGGLVVGVLGFVGIEYLGGGYLFGVGYDGIEAALDLGGEAGAGGLTIGILGALVLLKVLATSTTLAAGGSGGVFAPSIFIGAMLGGAFGLAMNAIFPETTAPAGAYALVGMGAVFAGTAHAPITSILILFEMTDEYEIILPLMIAVVVSYLVAAYVDPDSIYTIKVRRKGGYRDDRRPSSVLDSILVTDAMTMDHETVSPDESVESMAARFHEGHGHSACVVDADGRLVGIVSEFDVSSSLMAGPGERATVSDVMTRDLTTCRPGERLRDILERLADKDVRQIPVVDKEDPTKLVGILRRSEILWAYSELAVEHRNLLAKADVQLPADHRDSFKVEVDVLAGRKQLSFKRIREIHVPRECLCVLVRRADRSIIPNGNTRLEPGDVLVVVTTHGLEDRLREWVAGITTD
jgi:chloride channel protein, CIC family